eukprot:jgi/Botrbrau1/22090/Bobra.0206s0016.1
MHNLPASDNQLTPQAKVTEMLLKLSFKNIKASLFLASALIVIWICISVFRALSAWFRVERALRKSGIPSGPPFFAALEAAKSEKPHRTVTQWVKEFGPLFWFHLGPFQVLMVTDPALVTEVCQRPGGYDKPKFGFDSVSQICSDKGHPNLATAADSEHYRRIRKAMVPAFSTARLKRGFPIITGVVGRMMEVLQRRDPRQPFNASQFMCTNAMDIIGAFGFETDMGGIESLKEGFTGIDKYKVTLEACVEAGKRLTDPLRVWKLWDPEVRQGNRTIERFREILREMLRDMHTQHQAGTLDPESFTALLLNIIDPASGKPLHDDLLLPEVGILFTAGFETVAAGLSWVLYGVAQNPDVQDKVAAELASLGLLASPGNPEPRPIDWEDLTQLVYLDAVIKEGLRMWAPAALNTVRVVTYDLTLGGRYQLPKGALVWLPLYSIMRSEANWENADSFLPERFLEEGAELAKQSQKTYIMNDCSSSDLDPDRPAKRYVPFSLGARNCVGMSLGKVIMYTTLAAVFSRFSLRLAPQMGGPEGIIEREIFHVTLGVHGGLQLMAEPRY